MRRLDVKDQSGSILKCLISLWVFSFLQSDRSELISQIKALKDDNRQFKTIVDEKFREMEPLQQILGKLRSANNANRAGGLCSSEEELNSVVCFVSNLFIYLDSSFYAL